MSMFTYSKRLIMNAMIVNGRIAMQNPIANKTLKAPMMHTATMNTIAKTAINAVANNVPIVSNIVKLF